MMCSDMTYGGDGVGHEDDMAHEVSEHRVACAGPHMMGGGAVTANLTNREDVNEMTLLMDALSLQPLQYSYFTQPPHCLQLLDGPRHWKLLRPHSNTTAGDNKKKDGDTGQQQQQVVTVYFTFDYHIPATATASTESGKYKRTNRKRRQLAQQKLDLIEALEENTLQWREGSTFAHGEVMRRELGCVSSKPQLLVNLPSSQPSSQPAHTGDGESGQVEVDNYHYNNDMDNSYCPPAFTQGGGEYDDEMCLDTSADLFSEHTDAGGTEGAAAAGGDTGALTSMLTEDKLLQQPYKVENINIEYARTAKKIDIKRVKRCMWYIMTHYTLAQCVSDAGGGVAAEDITADTYHQFTQLVKMSGADTADSAEVEVEGAAAAGSKVCGVHLFTLLYQLLSGKLSGQSRDNLSMPIAFVCLLHLANEKKLRITTFGNGRDLIIAQHDAPA